MEAKENFQKLCKEHRIRLNLEQVAAYPGLAEKTLRIADRLKLHLQQMWQFDYSYLGAKVKSLEEQYSQIELNSELKKFFKELLVNLDELILDLAKGKFKKIAKVLGSLRFDTRLLHEETEGPLKVEFYLLELFLDSVELKIHPEVCKTIKLEVWGDVSELIDILIQKTLSAISIYQSEIALAEGVHHLEEFKKSKYLGDLNKALDYLNYGVMEINLKVVKEFKVVFKERMQVSQKELEELVSPFYRSGPLFQLEQLMQILNTFTPVIKSICKNEPKTVTMHLRERLLAQAGIPPEEWHGSSGRK